MNTVAVIPARGGSKRIPKKNIKSFSGKPMIAYSIQAAQATMLFDRIIVSTDSEEIAKTAESFGADVPFIRPSELADDFAGTVPVLLHAINRLKENQYQVDYLCCIYPTAPFVKPEYICKGFEMLQKHRVTSAFSVTTFPYPIFRALKINKAGHLEMIWKEHLETRSQDLPEAYHDAGQFYWMDADKFLKAQTIFASDAMPVILPRYLVQDIDTPEDWETAEKMYLALQTGNKNE